MEGRADKALSSSLGAVRAVERVVGIWEPPFKSMRCRHALSEPAGRERQRHSGLLETPGRIGVWPDSVQVLGGSLSARLPTRSRAWLYSGLRPVGHRGVVWLKRGVASSQ